MLKAREIMNAEPPYCHLDTPLQEIAQRFADEGISGMMVVDDDMRLLGVVTESDLIDQQANIHMPTAIAIFDMVFPVGEQRFQQEMERLQAMVAQDMMVEQLKTVDADASLMDVATLMEDGHVHYLPVLDDGAVVGVISRADMIRALARQIRKDS